MYIALATTNCTGLQQLQRGGSDLWVCSLSATSAVYSARRRRRKRRRWAQVILQVPYSSSSMCLFWTHKGPTGERVLLLLWS